MPTIKYFEKYPAFPTDVPVVDLRSLSLRKLMAEDKSESNRLFEASKEVGFFLVHLKDSAEGEDMLRHAELAFDLNEKLFETYQGELMKYAVDPPDLMGYKAPGLSRLEDGNPDGIEVYSISQDDILGTSPAPRSTPDIIIQNRNALQDFCHHAFAIIRRLLTHLDKHLGLQLDTLASFSPQDKPSGSSVRLLKCSPPTEGSPRTNMVAHTDIGSITMLFNIVGGLQILPAGLESKDENWQYVRPEPGCVVVNLGDAMVNWSGGILRSGMHRVAHAPKQQINRIRYSIAYLVRPEFEASMKRLASDLIPQILDEEEDIKARDWERKRAAQLL